MCNVLMNSGSILVARLVGSGVRLNLAEQPGLTESSERQIKKAASDSSQVQAAMFDKAAQDDCKQRAAKESRAAPERRPVQSAKVDKVAWGEFESSE
ncbi:hypothetical protein NDU88_008210 [Pleurodeles waltl]|uniref:Uncharacterized protein n=1 Tax=Pleurodeles waltl TaxID=8319 RepID=A0AAV7RX26_PLEWA|nr:hypothetical protein NDU88_008210 [Pleurodeles waltl]